MHRTPFVVHLDAYYRGMNKQAHADSRSGLGQSNTALYLATVLIWGSTWYAISFQLGTVHPAVSVGWRYVLAASVLVPFCIATRRSLRVAPRRHVGIALQGIFLFSLNYIVFYFATAHVTTGLLAVTFSTIIFMNIFNGALFLKNPIDRRVVGAACIGVMGIALVFWPELAAFNTEDDAFKGLSLGILATYLASLGNIASAYNQRHGLLVVETNALGMAYGGAFTMLLAMVLGMEITVDWKAPYLLSLVYLSLFGSILAFGSYLTLLGRIGADRAAYATVLFPIVALGISTVFEGYRWSWPALVGVALILVGNVIALRQHLRKR